MTGTALKSGDGHHNENQPGLVPGSFFEGASRGYATGSPSISGGGSLAGFGVDSVTDWGG
jgi:hypothetical protein